MIRETKFVRVYLAETIQDIQTPSLILLLYRR